jgi:hypothetical protein
VSENESAIPVSEGFEAELGRQIQSAASFDAGESAASVPIRGRNASVRVYKLE